MSVHRALPNYTKIGGEECSRDVDIRINGGGGGG